MMAGGAGDACAKICNRSREGFRISEGDGRNSNRNLSCSVVSHRSRLDLRGLVGRITTIAERKKRRRNKNKIENMKRIGSCQCSEHVLAQHHHIMYHDLMMWGLCSRKGTEGRV